MHISLLTVTRSARHAMESLHVMSLRDTMLLCVVHDGRDKNKQAERRPNARAPMLKSRSMP
jgi:hypothetical protein